MSPHSFRGLAAALLLLLLVLLPWPSSPSPPPPPPPAAPRAAAPRASRAPSLLSSVANVFSSPPPPPPPPPPTPSPLLSGSSKVFRTVAVTLTSSPRGDKRTLHKNIGNCTKTRLAAQLQCPLRDLRNLDKAAGSGAVILPRPGGIICNIPRFKANATKLVVLSPRRAPLGGGTELTVKAFSEAGGGAGDSGTASHTPGFLAELEGALSAAYIEGDESVAAGTKFHLVALEVLLGHALRSLAKECGELANECREVLGRGASKDRSVSALTDLLPLKNKLSKMEATVADLFQCLTDLLSEDEDLDLLSVRAEVRSGAGAGAGAGAAEGGGGHLDVELLLEDNLQQLEELLLLVRSSQSRVANTEAALELNLDLTRNKILRFELLLSITSLAISLGALVTGLFGMNLMSHLEAAPWGFWSTTGLISGLMWVVWQRLVVKLRKDIKIELAL